MDKKLKTTVISLLLAIAGMLGWQNANQGLFGSAFSNDSSITVVGTSSNLVSVPNSAVFANSTSTDAGGSVLDGGFTVQQTIDSGGIRKAILNIQAVGGTATSTLFVRQQGSFDGTNFFEVASSTANTTGTTTIPVMARAIQFDPGLATTSVAVPFEIDGYKNTRFIVHGENLTTDPNDGVQAWITATLVRDKEGR